jgi:transcriptional regulator with XRE-family HTH domain
MSLKKWEKKVLKAPGAERRVSEIERELRIAAGLAELREDAGLSQRELAKRIGVSQPRVAAIERSKNVTIDVLQQYVQSLGAELEVSAVKGTKKITLLAATAHRTKLVPPKGTKRSAAKSADRKPSARRTRAS